MAIFSGASGRRSLFASVLVVLAIILPGGVALGQCHYTYEFILSPPNSELANPYAINNLGHVAGSVEVNGTERGFLWTPEGGTQLLPMPPGGIRMQATGINDLDHVCGWMDDWAAQEVKAFLWDGSDFTFIRSPYPNSRIEALDVNNRDQVVGRINSGGLHAFIWESGTLTELDSVVGVPQPRMAAINDDSVMIGYAGTGGITHAWVLDHDGVHWLPEDGLAETTADGLSNWADVVGFGLPDGAGDAVGVVWDEPSVHLISASVGFSDAFCRAINNAGRVVGDYYSNAGARYGFVWQSGAVHRLDQLSGISVGASLDINQFGQVVAYGGIGAVVLTPVWKTGDLTGDCAVGLADLLLVLQNFGVVGAWPPRGDVDLNGVVDLSDLAVLLSNWGG